MSLGFAAALWIAPPVFAAVEDAATRALMEDFYSGVLPWRKQRDPATALRDAQLRRIDANQLRGELHPGDWAAFISAGG